MKAQPEKNVRGSARVLAGLRTHRSTAMWLRLVRVGWLVMVVAIFAGTSGVNAAPPPPDYPAECPSCSNVSPVPFNLSVTLQRPNAPPPDPSWVVPVHFSLHPPDKPDIVCWEWDLTTDEYGEWSGNLAICPGTYDARIKSPTTLSNLEEDVNVPVTGITMDMGTLQEGDADGDNCIRGDDFSILRASYWKRVGEPGFDERADFDGNGFVNAADFSLLRTHYWQCGE
jgi:hypothetical protein